MQLSEQSGERKIFEIGSIEIEETERKGIVRYAFDGIRIYRIRVQSMPGFLTNVYLLMDGKASLIDVGSHFPQAVRHLKEGFDIINREFGEDVVLDDVGDIIITHGHGDHFGMLCHEMLHGRRVYIHSSDMGAIADYPNHYYRWQQFTESLARESGVIHIPDESGAFDPSVFPINANDHDLIGVEDGQEIINGYVVHHTPGHTPGHICLRVGPVLFAGDHILSSTTPHQAPKRAEGYGLNNYMDSLRRVMMLTPALMGLAGHEETIYPVQARARAIEEFHHARLRELRLLCREERNLYALTDEYYRRYPELIGVTSIDDMEDVGRVGALEEVKAHVEYLLENELMAISDSDNGVPLYRSR